VSFEHAPEKYMEVG